MAKRSLPQVGTATLAVGATDSFKPKLLSRSGLKPSIYGGIVGYSHRPHTEKNVVKLETVYLNHHQSL